MSDLCDFVCCGRLLARIIPYVNQLLQKHEMYAPTPSGNAFKIRPIEDALKAPTVRFIQSWSLDDVYGRFGTAGIDSQKWLTTEIMERGRSAFIAVHQDRVVGLLDHVYAQGAIHIGIVVDSHFRRLSIGTTLVLALLYAKSSEHSVAAECQIDNQAAVALLHACRFQLIGIEKPEMLWSRA